MEPGLVSVMMPAFNAERHIGQAIGSLAAQSYGRWELIVVNDGSTDQTGRIARSCGSAQVRVFDQTNGGEASARNAALDQMSGEFVAFLDADDEYCPDHLEAAAGFLLSNPGFDATYSDGYYCDAAGNRIQTLASRRLPPSDGDIFEQVVRSSAMLGPPVCVVLRRSLIVKLGLRFDTAITIGPDWDFLTRYAETGRFKYIDRTTCLYRLHDSNISTSVGPAGRAADLARCRRKAIQLRRFGRCSVATRVDVFYDLLVHLLLGDGGQQAEITSWAAFKELPAAAQARILRLMASKTLAYEGDTGHVAEWLRRARELKPACVRAAGISVLHAVSPALCGLVLRLRALRQGDPRGVRPFSDIAGGSPVGPRGSRQIMAAECGGAMGADK